MKTMLGARLPHRTDGMALLVWPSTPNRLSSPSMTMDSTALMDSYGRKLLDELQANARLSVAELGRRIGLSATATAERMRQMEEIGILRGYTVEIDREVLGLEVLAFIRMSCNGPQYHRLLDYVQTLEEIRECHHLTGGDDLLL